MIVAPNSTDVTTYFQLVDPATGVAETGLTITDLDVTYVRDRATAVKADLTALAAVDSAHGDNKAIQVEATDAPGLYRVDWPDAAFAAGSARVQLIINGAAIAPAVLEVELLPFITPITGAYVLADLTAIGTVVQSLTDLKDFADTGYDPSTHKVAGVVLTDTATTLTNAPGNSAGVTELLTRVPDATAGESGGLPILNAQLEVPKVKALTDAPSDSSGVTEILTRIPDATAGASGGLAIVGSVMGKSAATLAAADVSGNLPVDVKAYTVQPTVDVDEAAIAVAVAAAISIPTKEAISTQVVSDLATAHGSGAWGPGSGAGDKTLTYTVTSSVDATPIENVVVELYNNIGMTGTPTQTQTTNAFGVATFINLIAGTYYLKRIKSGWSFTNPDTEAAS